MTTVETKHDDPRFAYGERLTPRQRLFVEAVAQDKTPTEAARLAGYTGDYVGSSAAALVKLPKIQQAVSQARTAYEAAHAFTITWWRKELLAAHNAAISAGDLPSRLRALELAGRHLGALESRADTASAELSARLTQHLVQAMAIQMATATTETPVTVEGEIRRLLPSALPLPVDDSQMTASEDVRSRARAYAREGMYAGVPCRRCQGQVVTIGDKRRCAQCGREPAVTTNAQGAPCGFSSPCPVDCGERVAQSLTCLAIATAGDREPRRNF